MDMCIITRARPPTMMGMFTITEGGPVPPSPCQTAIIIMSFRDKPLTTTDTFITIGGLRAKRLDETEGGTKRLWMGCESILDSPLFRKELLPCFLKSFYACTDLITDLLKHGPLFSGWISKSPMNPFYMRRGDGAIGVCMTAKCHDQVRFT